MELNRRDFLKLSGASVGGLVIFTTIGDGGTASAKTHKVLPLKKKFGEKTTICPYDGSGCGFIVASQDGKAVNIEGDPDHPINRGAACSKGGAIRQLGADNPRRLGKVLYRRPGGTAWEEKDWEWTLDQIAKKIKQTRDANWTEKDKDGLLVNRTEALAQLGGAALDNEECALLVKMARSLGIVYLEHQARI